MVMWMRTQRRGTGKGYSRRSRIAPSIAAKCGSLRCAAAPFILMPKIDPSFGQLVHRAFQRYRIDRKDANVILAAVLLWTAPCPGGELGT